MPWSAQVPLLPLDPWPFLTPAPKTTPLGVANTSDCCRFSFTIGRRAATPLEPTSPAQPAITPANPKWLSASQLSAPDSDQVCNRRRPAALHCVAS